MKLRYPIQLSDIVCGVLEIEIKVSPAIRQTSAVLGVGKEEMANLINQTTVAVGEDVRGVLGIEGEE